MNAIEQVPDIDYRAMAQIARHIITARDARPGVLARDLRMNQDRVEHLLTLLETAWGVIDRSGPHAARKIVIHRRHIDHVVDTITKCHGVPPMRHPFAHLAMPALSAVHQDIARLVALGYRNGQIAEELGIGVETVKSHLRHIFQVLGVSTRTTMVTRSFLTGVFGGVPQRNGESHA